MTETATCTWEGCSQPATHTFHDKDGNAWKKLCQWHFQEVIPLLLDVFRREPEVQDRNE